MRVVQVAPPFLPLDPSMKYGGVERMVLCLDENLRKQGIESQIIGTSDSVGVNNLIPTCPSVGMGDIYGEMVPVKEVRKNTYGKIFHVAETLRHAGDGFDIVHVHDDYLLPFTSFLPRSLLTLHCPLEDFWSLEEHPNVQGNACLVAISESQRRLYEAKGWKVEHIVYNPVPCEKFYCGEKMDYLLSLGAIYKGKGQAIAVEVARDVGMDLVIAGNIVDQHYFDTHVLPGVSHNLSRVEDKYEAVKELCKKERSCGPKIVYVGSVDDEQKAPLYAHARAFLMPIDVDEAFGLVMVEALASGTPVVGFDRGSVREIVQDGVTGYVVRDAQEMAETLQSIAGGCAIDPEICRSEAIRRFSAPVIAQEYVKVYEEILRQGR